MKRTGAWCLLGLAFVSAVASASVSDAEFQAIKKQLAIITQQLTDIQKERAEEKTRATAQAAAAKEAQQQTDAQVAAAKEAAEKAQAAVQAKPAEKVAAASWTDKIKLSGDFRYRHEGINAEGALYRSRERIRARAGLDAVVTDNIKVNLGLSTGNDDPISGNQTLDGGFSRKGFGLDTAFFDWTALKGAHVLGGKFKTPFFRPGDNQMIWDDDLRPEGLAATYDNGTWFGSGALLFAKENASADDIFIYGVQAGGRFNVTDSLKLTAGASWYDASDVVGKAFLYDPTKSFGNSAATNGTSYRYGYKEVEGFVEAATRVFELPLRIFGDYVTNTDASTGDTGWSAGVVLGEVKNKGSWLAGYTYLDLKPDAVLAVFTDSDFGGGGTNKRGHAFFGSYAPTDRTNLRFTYFLNETGVASGTPKDYDRLMLDFNFRY
jgi:hypothetical protein